MLARIERPLFSGLCGLDGEPLDFRAPREWCAFQARTMKEQSAADWLKLARMFAYWPCYAKDENRGRGQRRKRYHALIPGYIFIAMRQGATIDPHQIVAQVPGIIGYMRDGTGLPMVLGNDDIDRIRQIESDENLPPSPKTAHKFKNGQKVRFRGDLFSGWHPGKVERLADDGRIGIGVPLLGRIVTMLVYPHQIEAM
jgi:transcription antitermination factor NusG